MDFPQQQRDLSSGNYRRVPRPTSYEDIVAKCTKKRDRQLAQARDLVERRRDEDSSEFAVAFAVGVVVKHSKTNFTGVIISWAPPDKSPYEWAERVGLIPDAPNEWKQPIYTVREETNGRRTIYAAQG